MKVHPDCVPCLMKRILFQSRLVPGSDERSSVENGLKVFAEGFSYDKKSVDLATEVHRASYAVLGKDPYHDLKVRADIIAEKFMGMAQDYVDSSDDKLRACLMVSVIGNIMDFGSTGGIDNPEQFEPIFQKLIDQGLGRDDSDRIRAVLDKPGTIVYMFDNCGESQLDKIFIRYLRSHGKRVVGMVRGEPILNDVTYDDAIRSGLDREVDLLLTTGTFYVGIDWRDVPDDLMKEIGNSDLIIAKGMGNYESLSDEALPVPVVHVMRTKCAPVAESIGMPLDQNVVYVR
ncbi:ARMT1-like domain-containing protein [Methanomassiliicoccales archaeon LGM-RCC1]|nr:ARMT1-like domain-containing protein [Methanomassiliicoccales archaeon LGM-RCC1]